MTDRTSAHKILVVDDHPDSAAAATLLFRALGHDARAATSGTDGLAAATQYEPDIVVLDIGMPDISGYDVARQLRTRRGDTVYLVALTGWGQPADRARAFAAGFDLHIVKPANAATMRGIISAAEAALARRVSAGA